MTASAHWTSLAMITSGLALAFLPAPCHAQRPGEVLVPSSQVVSGPAKAHRVALHLVRQEHGRGIVGFEGMERRQPARNPQVWRKPAEQDPEADPLAAINQVGYQINRGINVIVEQPATAVYRTLLPQPVRRSVRNVVANFGIPVVVVNQVAQGKVNDAGRETTRFLTNSSLGVLGIFDVARDSFGILPTPREDLGQTLGNYGVSAGPALDVPVVGQTNPRDLLGLAGDWVVGNTLVPVGRVEGVGPGMAVAARLVQLDQAGPKAGFPEPTSTRGTYDLRRKQAIESRNQAIRR